MSRLRPMRLSRREQDLIWVAQAKAMRAIATVEEIAVDDGLLDGVDGPEAILRLTAHLRWLAEGRVKRSRLRDRAAR